MKSSSNDAKFNQRLIIMTKRYSSCNAPGPRIFLPRNTMERRSVFIEIRIYFDFDSFDIQIESCKNTMLYKWTNHEPA